MAHLAGAEREQQPLVGSLLKFNLAEILTHLYAEPTWQREKRNAFVLLKQNDFRVALMVLGAGVVIKEHAIPGQASLQVLHGRILFKAEDGINELGPGELIAFSPNLVHEVEGLEDAAFLLTLHSPDERAAK